MKLNVYGAGWIRTFGTSRQILTDYESGAINPSAITPQITLVSASQSQKSAPVVNGRTTQEA
jgi:hypothetical protein